MSDWAIERSAIKPGWIVEHNGVHEAVVTDVKWDGVRVRHTPKRAGRNEPEHEEFIPWAQVTAVRAPDRFGQIIERLKAIRSGALRRDDESFETVTNDAAWLVTEVVELTGTKLRLTEERDATANALREAREEINKLNVVADKAKASAETWHEHGFEDVDLEVALAAVGRAVAPLKTLEARHD